MSDDSLSGSSGAPEPGPMPESGGEEPAFALSDEHRLDEGDAATDDGPHEPLDEDEEELAERAPVFGGLHLALSFLTRLPLGNPDAPGKGALAQAMGMFPLAGVVIGGIGAAIYALAHQILPASVAALLAVAATILVTGGLHEDGLADTADGFGGGTDREKKVAIMRNSRIGSFGVLALLVALGLRVGALAEIGSSLAAAGALIAAHALARAAIPVAMQALAPARADGLGASAGRPSATQTGIAITLAVLVAALALPVSAALAALAGATIGTIVIILVADTQIGGQTGDVLGAVEQSAETLALLGALAAL